MCVLEINYDFAVSGTLQARLAIDLRDAAVFSSKAADE
jgi:hypothetical protein